MSKPTLIYRLTIALLLLVTTGLLALWWQQGLQLEQLQREVAMLEQRLEAAHRQARSAPATLLEPVERRALQRQGLERPEQQLLADLAERPELIPHAGVLGGSMHFVPEESRVLNRRWVWAVFEDGHVRGSMLLEYALEDGRIDWTPLRSALD